MTWLTAKSKLKVLGAVLLLGPALLAAQPVEQLTAATEERPQVIVHQDVPAQDSALSMESVRDIFLGKITRWSDGTPVAVGIINGDVHEAFCRAYLDMSSAEFDRYWQKKTGGDRSKGPRVVKDEQAMTVFIANIRGSIGYLGPE
jgi:ABC-type phosphate transport system substrate-binding protein